VGVALFVVRPGLYHVYVRNKFPSIQAAHRINAPSVSQLPAIAHMHVPGTWCLVWPRGCGVPHEAQRVGACRCSWCLSSWWCVIWIRNKLPLSNMPSFARYNGSTGSGRYSPLGGAGEGVQEVHLICRPRQCRVAQSIGLVKTGPNLVSELNGVEDLTQRTSADALRGLSKSEGAS
jgi:hypothetical protein